MKLKPNASIVSALGVEPDKLSHGKSNEISLGRDLLVVLSLLSWWFLIIQLVQVAIDGSAAIFGPGMGVFDQLIQLSLEFTDIAYVVWSICVSGENSWGYIEYVKALMMWQIMVAAMMIPSLLVLFQPTDYNTYSASLVSKFVCGYLAAWMLFSVPAVFTQWLLQTSGILNDGMMIKNPITGGLVLIGVGIIQMIAIKRRKLVDHKTTQSDLNEGIQKNPVYIAGLKTGLNCILRNGPLMAIMFVFGLMNIIAMAILTIVMLIEKSEDGSRVFSKLVAASLILLGFFYLIF